MSDQPTCEICQRRHNVGHRSCTPCLLRMHTHLQQISHYTTIALNQINPQTRPQPGPTSFASRPPINLDAIDPALTPIELIPGDQSSAVTILETLEMWERTIREDRNLNPYGPASAARNPTNDPNHALTSCVRFLTEHTDWTSQDPDFDLTTYADHLRRSAAALRRWDESTTQIGTRIACPAQLEDGPCQNNLRISTDQAVTCRRCGTTWTIEWLIKVAGDDVDGWADMESVCRLSGLTERTIRRWARAGKVRKRGLLYSIRDISRTTTKELTA